MEERELALREYKEGLITIAEYRECVGLPPLAAPAPVPTHRAQSPDWEDF
jgi:hypothetical protein